MALRYKEIRQIILELALSAKPHTRLPSRPQMCQQYLATRTTIDRAINELIEEGYLYSVNGSGTYVADFSVNNTNIKTDVRNVGVIVTSIMHDTCPSIIKGIEDMMENMDINVVICNTDDNQEKQNSYLRRLINSKIDGIIMIPTIDARFEESQELFMLLSSATIPVVTCHRTIPNLDFPFVSNNNFYGGYLATRHLLEHGYKHIAYLSAINYSVSKERYQGYLSALWESGLTPDPQAVQMAHMSTNSINIGYGIMDDLLRKYPSVDGVVCFNDRLARGAIQAIKDHQLRVSDDIGVIGYDNTEACDIMPERLTSIYYNTYGIGQTAAEIIIQKIKTPDVRIEPYRLFKPEVFVRDSCLGKKPD